MLNLLRKIGVIIFVKTGLYTLLLISYVVLGKEYTKQMILEMKAMEVEAENYLNGRQNVSKTFGR